MRRPTVATLADKDTHVERVDANLEDVFVVATADEVTA